MIDTSVLRYDRTQADSYEAEDLNRIGRFCEDFVSEAIAETQAIDAMRTDYDVAENASTKADFAIPQVQAKTDFAITDTYSLDEMAQYLDNVQNIVDEFPTPQKKSMPINMRFLTAESANNIEENLLGSAADFSARVAKTKTNIKNTASTFWYSGEIYAGGII